MQGRVACQDLVGVQMGPGLSKGEMLLEEQDPSMDLQAGRGVWRRRGWELFCEGRARGRIWP